MGTYRRVLWSNGELYRDRTLGYNRQRLDQDKMKQEQERDREHSRSIRFVLMAVVIVFIGISYLTSSASHRALSLTRRAQGGLDTLTSSQNQLAGKTSKAPQKIYIEHADILSYDASLQPGVQKLLGNIVLKHGNATMTCDSAYLNEEAQSFEAFGNVHMVQGDTINMYSRYLFYDGISKVARLRYNVHLANPTTDLYTDSLDYDRIADIAYYFEGGSVSDAKNTLTSDYGQFLPATNDAEFRYNVKLVNERTTMTTEHLFYNTQSQIGRYEGETLIVSDSGQIISQRGIYDVGKDIGILVDRSTVYSGSKALIGDSIYYDGGAKIGEAFGRMELSDTAQKATLFGDYGFFDDKRSYAFSTYRAHAEDYSQKDTLYVAADTLELVSVPIRDRRKLDSLMADTTLGKKPDTLQRFLRGYHHVRIYRRDAQAIADSMSYISTDSILSLYGRPYMWSEARQLSGDTTVFYFRNGKIDYVDVLGGSLVVEHIDSVDYYNQMRGDKLRAYIADSTVRQINVDGNVETILYMKDEKSNDYTGMNRMTSSTMYVTLDSGVVKRSFWTGPVEGKLYPLSMATTSEVNRLKDFVWASDRRPMDKEAVIFGIDSVSKAKQAPMPLSDLRKFSGIKAALSAYQVFDEQTRQDSLRTDSLMRTRKPLTKEEYRKQYQFVLRPLASDKPTEQSPIINTSWVSRVFSNKEDQDSSSTSSSTGILVKRN
jgi:hypothetical protein